MADTATITTNVQDGSSVTGNVVDGVTITTNVTEGITVTANVVTGAAGADGPSDHTLLTNIGTNTHAQIDTALATSASHIANTSNPHSVTKAQVGLSNVDNTSDANKPVSTATQNALDDKVDVEAGKGLSANDFTDAAKEKLDGIASGVMARIFSPIKPSAQSGGFGYTFAGSIEFYNAGTYAIGDYAEFLVPLAAGNYNFDISYATFSSAGIIKLTVDGVDIGATIDAYSATTVRYLQTTRSSVAVAGGLTPIRIEVTGKNASSSNYRYIIQSILANKV